MSEHVCTECAADNPYEPGTLGHDQWDLWRAGHRFWWTLVNEMRLPQIVDWLNQKLTR